MPFRAGGAGAIEFSLYAGRTPVSVWLIAKVMPVSPPLPGGITWPKGMQMMKNSTNAHKISSPWGAVITTCLLKRAAYVLALGSAVWVSGAHAQSGGAVMTCTNPSSGATWQIHVDYGGHTVDSNPAEITDTVVEWQSNGWKYSLDRKSGKLTVVVASSTGGNFLYDQCKLDK